VARASSCWCNASRPSRTARTPAMTATPSRVHRRGAVTATAAARPRSTTTAVVVAVDSVRMPKSVSPPVPDPAAAGVARDVVAGAEVVAGGSVCCGVAGGALVGGRVVGGVCAPRSAASRAGDPSGAARGGGLGGGTVVVATDGEVVGAARSAASRAADPSGAFDAVAALSRERSAWAAKAKPTADATSSEARTTRMGVGRGVTLSFYARATRLDCSCLHERTPQ
jgi:hypothetical protein